MFARVALCERSWRAALQHFVAAAPVPRARIPGAMKALADPAPASPVERAALLLAALAGAMLIAAIVIWTDPDPRGHGTHEQLGMAPCSWAAVRGEPCPTCGVTTAASLFLHLQPLASLRTQPFGFALTALLVLFIVVAFGYARRGQSLIARVATWPWAWITLGAVLLLLASWEWTKARWGAL